MREYKFRGKRIDNGEWVYGYYVKNITGNPSLVVVTDFSNANEIPVNSWQSCVPVNPDTICRYTGLKDKDGTPIFKNDILKLGLFKFKVIWIYDKYIGMESIDGITKYELSYLLQQEKATFISNIHD